MPLAGIISIAVALPWHRLPRCTLLVLLRRWLLALLRGRLLVLLNRLRHRLLILSRGRWWNLQWLQNRWRNGRLLRDLNGWTLNVCRCLCRKRRP